MSQLLFQRPVQVLKLANYNREICLLVIETNSYLEVGLANFVVFGIALWFDSHSQINIEGVWVRVAQIGGRNRVLQNRNNLKLFF